MVADIGVILAKDGTEFPTHGAKILRKDEQGIYFVAADQRVDVQKDALLLMLKNEQARMFLRS